MKQSQNKKVVSAVLVTTMIAMGIRVSVLAAEKNTANNDAESSK